MAYAEQAPHNQGGAARSRVGSVDQLPSGRWRARLAVNGERYRQTFDDPGQARQWLASTKDGAMRAAVVDQQAALVDHVIGAATLCAVAVQNSDYAMAEQAANEHARWLDVLRNQTGGK